MKNEWGYSIGRFLLLDKFDDRKLELPFMEDFRIGPNTGKFIFETGKYILMLKHKR